MFTKEKVHVVILFGGDPFQDTSGRRKIFPVEVMYIEMIG